MISGISNLRIFSWIFSFKTILKMLLKLFKKIPKNTEKNQKQLPGARICAPRQKWGSALNGRSGPAPGGGLFQMITALPVLELVCILFGISRHCPGWALQDFPGWGHAPHPQDGLLGMPMAWVGGGTSRGMVQVPKPLASTQKGSIDKKSNQIKSSG